MNSEKKSSLSVSGIVQAAVIAALYAALSFLTGFIPKVGGMFQFRVSEALTILPYFTVSAVPGLTIGCLITNIILGGGPYDIILGT
ncbi:MAG: QueT transporter family protein, partial [Clostridiales bacterium]|nr:QueT transporter family protein [Clostridiales bacterium]